MMRLSKNFLMVLALVFFFHSLPALGELPRLLVLPSHGSGLGNAELQSFDQALRLGFGATGSIRVITLEEMQEMAQRHGRETLRSCVLVSCQTRAARTTRTEFVVQAELRNQGTFWSLDLPVRDTSGIILAKLRLRSKGNDYQDLLNLGRLAPSYLVSQKARQDSSVFILQPASNQDVWLWASTATALGLAWIWFTNSWGAWNTPPGQGGYNFQENNAAQSGLQGFYASAAPIPRLRALGGAGSALLASPEASLLNPAALAGSHGKFVQMASSALPGGVPQLAFVYASPLGRGLWHAQHLRYEGDALAGEFRFTSNVASDLTLYSDWLRGLRAGMAISALLVQAGAEGSGLAHSSGTGRGWSMDAGLAWNLFPGAHLSLSMRDLASAMNYHNTLTGRSYQERLAPSVTTGAAWQHNSFLCVFDFRKGLWPDQKNRLHAGIEQIIWNIATLRGGMYRVLDGGVQTWNLGAGIKHSVAGFSLTVDYAWEIPGDNSDWWKMRHATALSLRW